MQVFPPSAALQPYIKDFRIFTAEREIVDATFFPSGFVDFAVNLTEGMVITNINGRTIDMPDVEVLGQLTRPTRLSMSKGMMVLIARIYPHANALFFPNPVSRFTNDSVDLGDVIGQGASDFYGRLMEAGTMEGKVRVMDGFLLGLLKKSPLSRHRKVRMIEQLCGHFSEGSELFNIRTLSASYGFSERYIQKLFQDSVGIAPRTFFSIRRFSRSLRLIQQTDQPLTSIAYDCGYFDQAHFIREFRKFTGLTPSEARLFQTVQ